MLSHPHTRKLPLVLLDVIVIVEPVVGVLSPVPEQFRDIDQLTEGDLQQE